MPNPTEKRKGRNEIIDVFLDDTRPCPDGFVYAKSAEECILLLKECQVRILSLDYHLGWDQPTGLEVARFIARHNLYPQVIYLHSSDPVGRMQMYQTLMQNKPEHVLIYNHPMKRE